MEAPPGYYDASNDCGSLIEAQALQAYYDFYQRLIPQEDFLVLNHDKIQGAFAIFVREEHRAICERKDAQVWALLESIRKGFFQ